MAKKKIVSRASSPRPDRQSKKRTGYVSQSVRLSVADNKILREAAALDGMSINFWASRALLVAANNRINKQKQKESVTLG
jgi:predicted HicB family RNase H-like nuclease